MPRVTRSPSVIYRVRSGFSLERLIRRTVNGERLSGRLLPAPSARPPVACARSRLSSRVSRRDGQRQPSTSVLGTSALFHQSPVGMLALGGASAPTIGISMPTRRAGAEAPAPRPSSRRDLDNTLALAGRRSRRCPRHPWSPTPMPKWHSVSSRPDALVTTARTWAGVRLTGQVASRPCPSISPPPVGV